MSSTTSAATAPINKITLKGVYYVLKMYAIQKYRNMPTVNIPKIKWKKVLEIILLMISIFYLITLSETKTKRRSKHFKEWKDEYLEFRWVKAYVKRTP